MPEIQDCINSFQELSAHLIPKVYLPTIHEVAFKRKRSLLVNRIPRSNKGVEGLKVYIDFVTRLPWAWRAMSEFGYTPTGNKFASAEMYAQLSCHASSAIVSLTEIEATQQGRWTNIIDRQMKALAETFPYYIKAMLWSSTGSQKALGKAASISTLTVTLDNVGLWNTSTEDLAKLFEIGMVVQVMRSGVKIGNPVTITGVDRTLGKIVLSSDPGVADNDTFHCADVGGLDQPYPDLFPGILDIIDDDNTFQGIDRSAAGNEWAKAVLVDNGAASIKTFATGHTALTKFFHKVYDPDAAFTNWKVYDCIAQWNQAQRQYNPNAGFVDNVPYVTVGKTQIFADDDVDENKLLVLDFGQIRIAERGGVENLYNMGWRQIPGRPFIEYPVVWWGLPVAEDVRYSGMFSNFTMA